MSLDGKRRLIWPVLGLAFSILIPSMADLQKYLGLGGVLVYLTGGFLLLLLGIKVVYAAAWPVIREEWVPWLAALTILVLLAFVLVVYPAANSGLMGGGSDSDDALTIAASELLQGEHPYSRLTYLGNPISPLPGAVLLAVPFVLLGNVAFQNVFWLAIFLWSARRILQDGRQALLLMWTILILSPVVSQQLAAGSDYLANSLYVLLFSLGFIHACSEKERAGWQKLLAAVLLGIALSSRANFLLLLPLLFAAVGQRVGWKEAAGYSTVAVLSFLVMTVPFYLWNPAEFSPLHTREELGQFRDVLPYAGVVVPGISLLAALGLALRENRRLTQYLNHAAVVQAVPVLSGILLLSARSGSLNFVFARFGVFFLFFGALGTWPLTWHLSQMGKS
jgi:hypothetical protein